MSEFFSMLALPIFPCSRPQSIVGASELNFCVRDGNRWTLTAINTNCMFRTKSASLGFCSVLLVYLSSGCPENISIILRFFHLSSAILLFSRLSPRATQRSGCEWKRRAIAFPISNREQPNEVVVSGSDEQRNK